MHLVVAICASAALQASTDCTRSGERCRADRVAGRPAGGIAPFAQSAEYAFPTPGGIPTCTGDAHCVASCYVSTGTTVVCKNSSGTDVGTVSQGTGPSAQGTFGATLLARKNVLDATAPSVVGSAFDNLLGGDLTLICGAYAGTSGSGTQAIMSQRNPAELNNTLALYTDGQVKCTFGETGVYPVASVTAAGGAINGWAITSCRRSGNNRIARANGVDGTTVSTAGTRGVSTGTTAGFGKTPNVASIDLNGPWAFCNFYDESKSTAWLTAAENAFWGSASDTGSGSSGYLGLLNDDALNIDVFAPGAHVVSQSRGLRTVGHSNDNIQGKWAADPIAIDSLTDVGTPTVTTNVMAGPFARWKAGTAECDRILDNDGAAFEGKVSAELQRSTSAGAAHGWTQRVWAATGDAGATDNKMRVTMLSDGVFVDGGTEFDCDFTLTAVPTAYDCTAYTRDAGVSTMKAQVLVGNTAATQGSITVCHVQDTPHFFPELAVINNTAFGYSSDTLDPATWPSTALKGRYEVVFTPLWDFDTQWDNTAGTIYLFDAYDLVPAHDVVMILGYTAGSLLMARTTRAGLTTEFQVGGLSSTAGQRYAVSMEWQPTTAGHCKVWLRFNSCSGSVASCTASTIVASSLDGTGWCPDQPTTIKLGNRLDDNSFPTSVFIDTVRIYQ